MCRSMVYIQSATAEIRRGIKNEERKKGTTGQKYNVRICYAELLRRAAIISNLFCIGFKSNFGNFSGDINPFIPIGRHTLLLEITPRERDYVSHMQKYDVFFCRLREYYRDENGSERAPIIVFPVTQLCPIPSRSLRPQLIICATT